MTRNLDQVSLETLQQRLFEEIDAQERLQKELEVSLRHEQDLRLENEVLWVYLQDKYPGRVDDAADLLERLSEGSDLTSELQERSRLGYKGRNRGATTKSRNLMRRTREVIGKFPGAHSIYRKLKSLGR